MRFAVTVAATAVVTAMTMQAWSAGANDISDGSTFVSIEPCRLFDFRPGESPFGGKKSPLASGAANAVTQQVTGAVGDCDVPPGAVAVAMNMTVTNGTRSSFLRVYPADVAAPNVSSLNWVAGQSPTPNKVDVRLSGDGRLRLFNHAGTVDVLADVVGYYVPSGLGQIAERLALLEAAAAGGVPPGDFLELAEGETAEANSLEVVAPVAGTVVVTGSASASDMFPGGKVFCSISTGTDLESPLQAWESAGIDGSIGQLAGTRSFDVAAGTHTFRWICQSATSDDDQSAFVSSSTLTYVFVPG